jgi:hypothetical protein
VTASGSDEATATSGSFTASTAGYYCFAGYYSGDSNYSSSADTSTHECYDVTSATTSTQTAVTDSTIALGQSNSDSATVTGNSAGGSPTGTVSFYECGPTASATPCTSQTDEVGTAVALTPGAGDTSSAPSASFTPSAPGYWCFAGYYSGDSNYAVSSDTTVDECFDVTTVSSATTTTPAASSIVLGSSNSDAAIVSGNSTGGNPTGTVTFYECGPTANATPCTSQANEVGTAVTVVAGAGDTSTASSATFTPSSTGYYCFAGYYSGDANYNASTDATVDECFDVTAASTSTTTAPTTASVTLGSADTDTATVTGNDPGGSPTGTVTFYECGPTVNATPCTSKANPVGSAVTLSPATGDTSFAQSADFTPDSTGYWCFAGYYSGDSNYTASTDATVDECFSVTEASAGTTTTPTHSTIVLGNTNSDGATVTGDSAGGAPTGTVTFYECGPEASATPCTSQANEVGTAVALTTGASDTSTASSSALTPHATGTYCFAGYYSGDSNYAASSDTSIDECFTVTAAASTTTSNPATTTINLGSTDSDNASVTGNTDGGAPSGTVTFYECGPTATAEPCTSQANKVGSAVTLTAGAGDVSYASSASITPADPGYYCFGAYYSGSSNYGSSSDTSVTECFDVLGATPTITSFSPTSGPVGTKVTIFGTNLAGATKVTFNGVTAVIKKDTATKLKVVVPSGFTKGLITVTTPNGSVTSTKKFKVT